MVNGWKYVPSLRGRLEAGGLERGGDVVGGLVEPGGADPAALALRPGEEEQVLPHPLDGVGVRAGGWAASGERRRAGRERDGQQAGIRRMRCDPSGGAAPTGTARMAVIMTSRRKFGTVAADADGSARSAAVRASASNFARGAAQRIPEKNPRGAANLLP